MLAPASHAAAGQYVRTHFTWGLAFLMRVSVASTVVRLEFRPLMAALQHTHTTPRCQCTAICVAAGSHQQGDRQLHPQDSIRKEPPPVCAMREQAGAAVGSSLPNRHGHRGVCLQLYERVISTALTCSRR
jgi:hypothetical protein